VENNTELQWERVKRQSKVWKDDGHLTKLSYSLAIRLDTRDAMLSKSTVVELQFR